MTHITGPNRPGDMGHYQCPLVLFHDEDDIGPVKQFRRQRRVCTVVQPGGQGLDPLIGREHRFGGRAAQTVLAADEEEVHPVLA